MNQLDRQRMFHVFQRIGCIPCRRRGFFGIPPDAHHPNLGGHAGQKRLGNDIVIPVCPWHHRAVPMFDMDYDWCRASMGPSLKDEPNKFREEFGTDDELIAERRRLIARYNENLVSQRAEHAR